MESNVKLLLSSGISPEDWKYMVPIVTKTDLLALEDAVNWKVMWAMDQTSSLVKNANEKIIKRVDHLEWSYSKDRPFWCVTDLTNDKDHKGFEMTKT